jgi:hypothetical protein
VYRRHGRRRLQLACLRICTYRLVAAGGTAGSRRPLISAGIDEGQARVVLDVAHADIEAGDVPVAAYTYPSWVALLVVIKGLMTRARIASGVRLAGEAREVRLGGPEIA